MPTQDHTGVQAYLEQTLAAVIPVTVRQVVIHLLTGQRVPQQAHLQTGGNKP